MNSSGNAGVNLTYRPPVKPNESIVGYIYRAMHAGGHVRMKGLATTLAERNTIQPPWTVPSNLRRLCEEMSPVFESAEKILESHTCLPAHIPFVAPSSRGDLLAHVFDGVRGVGVASMVGLAGRAVKSVPRMAMCRTCCQEDQLKHGLAYWHREHALAGIGYCPHHGTPLLVGCGECRFSQLGSRIGLMPQRFCWCGANLAPSHRLVSKRDGQVLARMAGYGTALLDGRLSSATPNAIGAYFHHCACRAGFSQKTRLRTPALVEEICRKYSSDVLWRLNSTVQSGQSWLHSSLANMHATPYLGRNLLLFDFFERHIPSYEELNEALLHSREVETQRLHQRRSAASAHDAELQADRQSIQNYLRTDPGATRSTLLKALGRTVMRARERDADWYAALVPSRPRGGAVKNQTEQTLYWREFDIRTSAHVLRRCQELLDFPGGYPKAITKSVLLKGAPRGNEVSAELLEKLPNTKQAIESSVESTQAFKERFARAILLQPRDEVDRVEEAKTRTGLTLAEIDRINFKILARAA